MAQDYFSAKVATLDRLSATESENIKLKLQQPANTNRLHWRKELKRATENARITHHDDNFEFFFDMTSGNIMLVVLVWQTEEVNIGTFCCFICHGSFTIQSRTTVHGENYVSSFHLYIGVSCFQLFFLKICRHLFLITGDALWFFEVDVRKKSAQRDTLGKDELSSKIEGEILGNLFRLHFLY